MSARLTSGFFVAALLRTANGKGAVAMLRQRGAEEAGVILVKVDRLDGTADLWQPVAQSEAGDDGVRRFERGMTSAPDREVEDRIARERRYDPDIFVVEIEDRAGRAFLNDG